MLSRNAANPHKQRGKLKAAMYKITITQVGRITYWKVEHEGALVADGENRPGMYLSLVGAKMDAKARIPEGAEYTLTLDISRGIYELGPFTK